MCIYASRWGKGVEFWSLPVFFFFFFRWYLLTCRVRSFLVCRVSYSLSIHFPFWWQKLWQPSHLHHPCVFLFVLFFPPSPNSSVIRQADGFWWDVSWDWRLWHIRIEDLTHLCQKGTENVFLPRDTACDQPARNNSRFSLLSRVFIAASWFEGTAFSSTYLPSRRLCTRMGLQSAFLFLFLTAKVVFTVTAPDLKTDCEYDDVATCTCDRSVKLSLRAKVAVGDVTVALRSVTKMNCVTAPVTRLVHYRCPTTKSCSVTFSRTPNHRVSPPFTTLVRRWHWDYDCGESLTTGCVLFVFLRHCELPCTEVFPRQGCLVARGCSCERRLNFFAKLHRCEHVQRL